MKKPDRVTAIFGAVVLAAVIVVGGFSAASAAGDQDDPLVTLSYLTQVVTPELLEKVDEQVAANELALLDKLDEAIDDYAQQMEQLLAQGSGSSASFTAVSVAAGQRILPQAGSELLLRTGTAAVSAGTSPILLDATTGSTLGIGSALQANHLYVAPLDGAGITVSSSAVFLVRGSYTLA